MPKIGRSATTCSLSSRRCSPAVGTGGLRVAPMYLRGIPSPESVGKNAPGEERLSPSTSICKTLIAQKFGRRDARCKRWRHYPRVAGRLFLGLGFWVWVG